MAAGLAAVARPRRRRRPAAACASSCAAGRRWRSRSSDTRSASPRPSAYAAAALRAAHLRASATATRAGRRARPALRPRLPRDGRSATTVSPTSEDDLRRFAEDQIWGTPDEIVEKCEARRAHHRHRPHRLRVPLRRRAVRRRRGVDAPVRARGPAAPAAARGAGMNAAELIRARLELGPVRPGRPARHRQPTSRPRSGSRRPAWCRPATCSRSPSTSSRTRRR